jgi:four helix bundle protein
LKVWQKAHALTLDVYRATTGFPKEERYGLTSQLRRATASIPANIAEGCGRGGDADFGRFVQIAMGSASETEYHVLLACDLGYLAHNEGDALVRNVVEVKQMLSSLLRKLKADS